MIGTIRHALAAGALPIVLLTAFAARSQEPLDESLARSRAEQTIRRVEEALAERPNDGTLQFYMAMFQAQAGHREQSIEWLRRVAARHMGFHPTPGSGFESLWSDPEFQQVLSGIAAQEPKVLGAREAFRLADPAFVPEGIAYDARGKRYFLGSVAQRRILERTRGGRFVEFSRPTDGLKSVLGVHVDAPRGRLYAVSTNGFSARVGEAPDDALFVYDLKSAAMLARYGAPEAISLNDVAVGPAGEVVVTDSGAGAVYQLEVSSAELIFLVPPRGLSSANGVTFAPDGKHIYVAAATGVAVVDLATGAFERLPQPDDIATGAIDGLYYYDGDLIGVQNVICPGRIVRLDLDAAGSAITGLTVLQAYHPLLDEPTTGAIVGKTLHVIANSSIAHVQPNGTLSDEAMIQAAAILSIPLTRP